MSSPRITVVVAAYNASSTIGATLTGIFSQTYPNIEVIVVDDESTDDTAEIVRAYGDRARLIQGPNRGPSCRNRAFEVATGEFIAWCDADDQYLPSCLEAMCDTYVKAGGGRRIVFTQAHLLSAAGLSGLQNPGPVPPASKQRMALLEGNFISSLCFYPASMHDEIGPLDYDLRYGEDRELWIRAVFAGYEVVRQDEPLALYRLTDGSASTQSEKMYAADLALVRKTAESDIEFTPEEAAYLERRLGAGRSVYDMINSADNALRHGEGRVAREELSRASSLMPSNSRLRMRARLATTTPGRVALTAALRRSDRRHLRTRGSFTL